MENEDELIEQMYAPRKLEEEEYSTQVIFVHEDWLSLMSNDKLMFKRQETEKEIIQYLDLDDKFREIQTYLECFREDPKQLFWIGEAGDLLKKDSPKFGITEDQLAILEVEGDLYEFKTSPLNLFDPENPYIGFLEPLGFAELRKEFEERLQSMSDELG